MIGNRQSLVPAAAALVLLLAIGCAQVPQTAALRILGGCGGIKNLREESETLGGEAFQHTQIARSESSFSRKLRQNAGGAPPSGLAAWNPRIHGYTAGISVGVLMPATAIISRSFREFAPAWFYLHAPLGIVAVIGGILGLVFGAQLPEDGLNMTLFDAHKAIGVLAVVFAGLQITALVLRPKPDHPKRYIFNHVHHNIGRLALACGIAATYLGLEVAGEARKFFVGYSIVLAVLAAVWLAKEALDLVRIGAHNRCMRKEGSRAPSLPGGFPMNGGFAATFMQRRSSARSDNSDTEAALPHGTWAGTGGSKRSLGFKAGLYANSNPSSKADLLRAGDRHIGGNTANSSATSLHQDAADIDGTRGTVEMQRL